MNSRSNKYHTDKKSGDGSKKGSANKGGYNEQNEASINRPNENPAASEDEEMEQSIKNPDDQGEMRNNTANQDDTGGGNNSGKRSDPH